MEELSERSNYYYQRRYDRDENVYAKYKHVDIDLGENTKVTYIGTKAKHHPVYTFPALHEIEEYDVPKDFSISYIDRIDRQWVKAYTIYARVDSGRKWEKIGEFGGNTCIFTEVVNKLQFPIEVRYIRFVPTDYIGSPSVQIGLYGPGEKVKKAETNVVYVLEAPSKREYSVQGYSVDQYPRRWYGNNRKYEHTSQSFLHSLNKANKPSSNLNNNNNKKKYLTYG